MFTPELGVIFSRPFIYPHLICLGSGYGYLAPPPVKYGMGRSNSAQDLPMAVSTSNRTKKRFGSQQAMTNSNYGSLRKWEHAKALAAVNIRILSCDMSEGILMHYAACTTLLA